MFARHENIDRKYFEFRNIWICNGNSMHLKYINIQLQSEYPYSRMKQIKGSRNIVVYVLLINTKVRA